MTISHVRKLTEINAQKFNEDIGYAAEVTSQIVHQQINSSIEQFLSKKQFQAAQDNINKNAFPTMLFGLPPEQEKQIHKIIRQELVAINQYFNQRFSDEQLAGLAVHLKQFLTPYNNNLGILWHYRFNFFSLTKVLADPLLTCVAVRLWNELNSSYHVFGVDLPTQFREKFSEAFHSLASITQGTSKQDLEELDKAIERFVDGFVVGRMGNDHQLSNTNTFIYRAPLLLMEDMPEWLKLSLVELSTRLFITPTPENHLLPNLSHFFSENEKDVIENIFPKTKFRQWCASNVQSVLDFVIRMTAKEQTSAMLGFDKNLLKISIMPCGLVFGMSALIIVASIIDCLCLNSDQTDVEDMDIALLGQYLDISKTEDKQTWIAICLNTINLFTEYGAIKTDTQVLEQSCIDQMRLLKDQFGCKISNLEIESCVKEAIFLYCSYKESPLQESLQNQLMKMDTSGANPASFFNIEQSYLS